MVTPVKWKYNSFPGFRRDSGKFESEIIARGPRNIRPKKSFIFNFGGIAENRPGLPKISDLLRTPDAFATDYASPHQCELSNCARHADSNCARHADGSLEEASRSTSYRYFSYLFRSTTPKTIHCSETKSRVAGGTTGTRPRPSTGRLVNSGAFSVIMRGFPAFIWRGARRPNTLISTYDWTFAGCKKVGSK
jgi:hypothetical protein